MSKRIYLDHNGKLHTETTKECMCVWGFGTVYHMTRNDHDVLTIECADNNISEAKKGLLTQFLNWEKQHYDSCKKFVDKYEKALGEYNRL